MMPAPAPQPIIPEPNANTSYGIGFLLVLALNLAAYVVHVLAGGSFALPPDWLAVLLPLDPVLTGAVGYLTNAILTGDWRFPIVPSPAPVRRLAAAQMARKAVARQARWQARHAAA